MVKEKGGKDLEAEEAKSRGGRRYGRNQERKGHEAGEGKMRSREPKGGKQGQEVLKEKLGSGKVVTRRTVGEK